LALQDGAFEARLRELEDVFGHLGFLSRDGASRDRAARRFASAGALDDGRVCGVKRSSSRRVRPRHGQHFLVNTRTVEKILDALGASEGETVVEIGPGRGALTRPLLDRGVRVLAFEIDHDLAEALEEELSERAFFLQTEDAL